MRILLYSDPLLLFKRKLPVMPDHLINEVGFSSVNSAVPFHRQYPERRFWTISVHCEACCVCGLSLFRQGGKSDILQMESVEIICGLCYSKHYNVIIDEGM